MRRFGIEALVALGALCALGMAAGGALAQPQAGGPKPTATASTVPAQRSARQVADAAAKALGGVDKLRAINTITAVGYGQYAYMMGGGRISGDPNAPEKYMAANDLSRVYDLEHDRFQMKERRNMVFPFLAPFGHSFALNNNILDGDVAFDITDGGGFGPPQPPHPVRQARFSENALILDGVHMRRMWAMNNPVVLVRAMLDPATRLSPPRTAGGLTVVDIVLKHGDKLSAGFEKGGLPAFVRWSNPQTNLGQVNLTTTFSGWAAWDGQGGVLMPLGYDTRLDWRNVDFFKLYVDAYKVNAPIDALAAPEAIRAAKEPESYAVQPPTSVKAAPGIWRIEGGTTVIEFKDHLVLFELGVNSRGQAKAVLDHARSLAPGKPITQLVASHNHFDHTAGLREAVAQGITLIQRPQSLRQFAEMAAHPAPDFPDDLAKSGRGFKSIAVDEHLTLKDSTRTLEIYWGRNNGHMADVVFAYEPKEKVLMEGDLVTAAYDWQHWPDTFRDVIAYYRLDPKIISPVHSVVPEHPDLLTREQAEELLTGGTRRAREHCANYLAKGDYAPGCPVQSKYY